VNLSLAFATPQYLLLALLPLGAALAWRGAPRARRALFALAGLALAVAAAGPLLGLGDAKERIVLVLDASASLPAPAREAALRRAEEEIAAEPGADLRRVAFAATAQTAPSAADLALLAGAGLPGATDIQLGLDAAQALAGPGGRVLLLSDGRHLGPGDPLAAAIGLARSGARLYTRAIWPERAPDVGLRGLALPPEVPSGQPLQGTVTVSCQGPVDPAAHSLEVSVDGVPQRQLALPVPCGARPSPLSFDLRLDSPGRPLVEVTRRGRGDDLVFENDRVAASLEVSGPPRVLWVGDERPAHPVLQLLRRDGELPTLVAPEALLASAAQLRANDLVILDDVAAQRLQEGRDAALEAYVRGGGGLLAFGGPESFGAGGYARTRLEALLPVSSDLRRSGGRLAALLLVDKSGSMGGYEQGWERLLLAKTTLRSLLDSLERPDDQVGVLGFDTAPQTILPLTRVAELDREGLDTGAMQAGGGTDPTPALQAAALELESSGAPLRQIIAITDGRFAGEGVEPELRRLVARGIRFSAIGVGGTAQMQRLEQLAALGKGGVSWAREARHLPSLVLRELLRASGGLQRSGGVEVEPGSNLAELYPDLPLPIPPLDALARTLPKEGAASWLRSAVGEPVLAGWRQDAGVAVAFPSAPGRWTSAWAAWPGQEPLWRAVLAAVSRREGRPWEAVASVEGDQLTLRLDAVAADGSPQTGRTVEAQVIDPADQRRRVDLEEQGPGFYLATLPLSGLGRYRATFQIAGTVVAEADAFYLLPAELQHLGNDDAALTALAEAGGGALLTPDARLPAADPAGRARRSQPGPFLALSLLLFLGLLAHEAWVAHRSRRAR